MDEWRVRGGTFRGGGLDTVRRRLYDAAESVLSTLVLEAIK